MLTAFCWAENSLIWGYLGRKVGSNQTAHLRMWIAVPALLLCSFLTEGPIHADARTWLVLLTSGILGFFITDVLVFHSYVLLGTRQTVAIQTLSPVVSTLLSLLLFGEWLTGIQLVGLCTTILGVALLIVNQTKTKGTDQKKGVILSLVAAVVQSVSLVLTKFALSSSGPMTTNTIRAIGGLASLFLYEAFRGKARSDFSDYRKADRKYLWFLLLGAILGPVIGMSSEMKAFTLAPLGTVTAIAQSSPIILLLQEGVFGRRNIAPKEIVFTLLSVFGITLLFLAV